MKRKRINLLLVYALALALSAGYVGGASLSPERPREDQQ